MFRLRKSVVIVLLVLSLGGRSASAGSSVTVHTHSGFGLLFVLASDFHGNLYVADQKHDAILKLSPSGHLLLRDSMPKRCGISGLAASSSGDVYAVANCQSLVYHFSPSGRLLQRFGDQPPGPNGVAVDGQGHVYVTYGTPPGAPPLPPGAPPGARVLTFANRFVEFTPMGTALRTVKLAGLHQSWGIAVDGRGNVYVTGTEALVKVSPTGHMLGRWSRVVPARRKYVLPGQPAVDQQGNVYATDGPGNILKVSSTGQLLGVLVKHGSGSSAARQPVGLTIDRASHLFVGDAGPNRIKEFSLTGKLLAVWTP
jgi:serine/threonine protein kinase, bacterial